MDQVDPDDLGLTGQHVHLHLRHCGRVHVVLEDVLVRLPRAAHRSAELGEAAGVGLVCGAAHFVTVASCRAPGAEIWWGLTCRYSEARCPARRMLVNARK